MIEVIVETVIATLLLVAIAFMVYKINDLKKSKEALVMELIQSAVDKEAISKKLEETVGIVNSTNIEDKDGFIKFLSESREWAFEYIENVQSVIAKLEVAMSGQDEEKIKEAYLELVRFMPEEEKNT